MLVVQLYICLSKIVDLCSRIVYSKMKDPPIHCVAILGAMFKEECESLFVVGDHGVAYYEIKLKSRRVRMT